ncbi:hypothetical protein Trydic_g10859 [Trypoxylus dichotomus]
MRSGLRKSGIRPHRECTRPIFHLHEEKGGRWTRSKDVEASLSCPVLIFEMNLHFPAPSSHRRTDLTIRTVGNQQFYSIVPSEKKVAVSQHPIPTTSIAVEEFRRIESVNSKSKQLMMLSFSISFTWKFLRRRN